jgi:hypothetical protein
MTLRWVPGWNGLTEPEAVSYVAAVEAADGAPLEFGVARAINDFVLGCKTDGIWDAIKASCILAGARTLSGALVPLVGTAPTKFGTEAGWNYNRETGLKGNGTDNYLDSNRANNTDPQNSKHVAVRVSQITTTNNQPIFGTDTGFSAGSTVWYVGSGGSVNAGLNSTIQNVGAGLFVGLNGVSRSSSAAFTAKLAGGVQTYSIASSTPVSNSIYLLTGYTGSVYSNARLAFYSIGESLDLALLDTRVSALITAIGAAIP